MNQTPFFYWLPFLPLLIQAYLFVLSPFFLLHKTLLKVFPLFTIRCGAILPLQGSHLLPWAWMHCSIGVLGFGRSYNSSAWSGALTCFITSLLLSIIVPCSHSALFAATPAQLKNSLQVTESRKDHLCLLLRNLVLKKGLFVLLRWFYPAREVTRGPKLWTPLPVCEFGARYPFPPSLGFTFLGSVSGWLDGSHPLPLSLPCSRTPRHFSYKIKALKPPQAAQRSTPSAPPPPLRGPRPRQRACAAPWGSSAGSGAAPPPYPVTTATAVRPPRLPSSHRPSRTAGASPAFPALWLGARP